MIIKLLDTGKQIEIEKVYDVVTESAYTYGSQKNVLHYFKIVVIDKEKNHHIIDLIKEAHKWIPQHDTDHICAENLLVLNDGSEIVGAHSQDCCEYNYADMAALEDTTFFDQVKTVRDVSFGSSEYGFTMNGYFVPCYSEQNGYYSNEVSIFLNGQIKIETIIAKEDEENY